MARSAPRSEWARRYPPLAGGLIAAILAATVLPSSLNVPQTNPQQTLEFAPVPPSDEDAPPPPGGGDLGSLSLGSSAGPAAEGAGGVGAAAAGAPDGEHAIGTPPPPLPPPGAGSRPVTKQCVGNPPRQTEDPLAPPCVAFFDGDNGGATYQGVTAKEVVTLFVWDAGTWGPTSRGMEESPPAGTYVDLMKPPPDDEEEMIYVRELRAWQRYFNERYQTYGRRVHFWIYFANGDLTPEGRKATAAENYKKLRPFAVVPRMAYAVDPYSEAMAARGVMNFGGFALRDGASFQTFPGLAWAYQPTVEQRARTLSSFVCTKMARHPVSFSGNPGENGKPRKFGLVYLNEPTQRPYATYYREFEKQVKSECGITFGEGRRHEIAWTDDELPRTAAQIAELRQNGVTTLINLGGQWSNFSVRAATGQSYFPEWVFGGDTRVDGSGIAQQFDQQQMEHAWLVTAEPLMAEDGVPKSCAEAIRSVDPSVGGLDMGWYCSVYPDIRQYFTGIQVAGPRLSPASMEQGFRAIPARRSSTPDEPACYYLPGDYTCVKDAMAEWWDVDGGNRDSSTAGCWRAVLGGRRFRAGEWPPGDPLATKDAASDPCNTFRFASP